MRSRKPEAEAFQEWVYELIQTLRKGIGIADEDMLSVISIKSQVRIMRILYDGLRIPVKPDYTKANVVINRIISDMLGSSKLLSKDDIPQDKLALRQDILEDVCLAMVFKDNVDKSISVSKVVRDKWMVVT
jgi:hypothetical protein